jgi:ABC-type uncharacterized transport system permease subunit
MSLNDSPSLQDFSPMESDQKPQGKKSSWVVIAVLFVIVVALALFNLLRSDQGAVLRGAGSINGRVVDMDGVALEQAEVFLENGKISTWTDVNGNFMLTDVAAGEYTLVAGYEGIGVEHTVTVTSGTLSNAGTIVIDVVELPTLE